MTDCYFTGISKQLITVSSSLKILGAFQKSLFLSQRNTSQSKKSRYKSMLEYPVQRFNIQISSIHTRNIYFSFTDYTKAFDFVGHSKQWKILEAIRIPDLLTCLRRTLCAGQEATVRTGHGTTDWFKIGKGVHQGCILSPCSFNLCAEFQLSSVSQSCWTLCDPMNRSTPGLPVHHQLPEFTQTPVH